MTDRTDPDDARSRAVPTGDSRAVTGWQSDGSYVPCPECQWAPTPRPEDAFSTPVHMPGTTHHGDCPTVPRLSKQDEAELRERLAEMDRVRRRGAAEARNFVIG